MGKLGLAVSAIFFKSVFRCLCQQTSVFRFWCALQFADFQSEAFGFWYSYFVLFGLNGNKFIALDGFACSFRF